MQWSVGPDLARGLEFDASLVLLTWLTWAESLSQRNFGFFISTFSVCVKPVVSFKKISVLLQDARHAAEAEIYSSLNAKIDQFLQLADYDWMSTAQGGGNLSASDYLVDLIAFLRSTFAVFTNLPVSAQNTHTMTIRFTLQHFSKHICKVPHIQMRIFRTLKEREEKKNLSIKNVPHHVSMTHHRAEQSALAR